MKNKVDQILNKILEDQEIDKKNLAKLIGIMPQSISGWRKRGNIGKASIEKIRNVYPQYSKKFLLGEEEERSANIIAETEGVYGKCKECLKKDTLIERMQTEIEQKDVKIEELNRVIGGLMAGGGEGKREACYG